MSFTDKEVALMRRIGLNMDFNHPENLSSGEWIQIEEGVADRLVLNELDENYFPTSDGKICENILGKLP